MSMPRYSPKELSAIDAFTAFYKGWIVRQQALVERLAAISADEEEEAVEHFVEQLMGHYRQYYAEKAAACRCDVSLVFSPPWLTTLERALLWFSGFKPSIVFPLVHRSVVDQVSTEQMERIETVRMETKSEERSISEAMAKVQESVAAPPIFNSVRDPKRLADDRESQAERAREALKESLMEVVCRADDLRDTTVTKVLQILGPSMSVRFLVASGTFLLHSRSCGLEKDSQRIIDQ